MAYATNDSIEVNIFSINKNDGVLRCHAGSQVLGTPKNMTELPELATLLAKYEAECIAEEKLKGTIHESAVADKVIIENDILTKANEVFVKADTEPVEIEK